MENLKRYIQTLAPLSAAGWEILQGCLTLRRFKKGERLLQAGEVCTAIFFISTGYCKATYSQEDGKQVNTAFYFENDFATNTKSLISGTKSEFDIVACTTMEVIAFDKAKLLEAYTRAAEIETFGRKVLELIVARQDEHLKLFTLLTPAQRFEHLVQTQPEFLQRVSLTQTASYLGMSRETLSRLRRK